MVFDCLNLIESWMDFEIWWDKRHIVQAWVCIVPGAGLVCVSNRSQWSEWGWSQCVGGELALTPPTTGTAPLQQFTSDIQTSLSHCLTLISVPRCCLFRSSSLTPVSSWDFIISVFSLQLTTQCSYRDQSVFSVFCAWNVQKCSSEVIWRRRLFSEEFWKVKVKLKIDPSKVWGWSVADTLHLFSSSKTYF